MIELLMKDSVLIQDFIVLEMDLVSAVSATLKDPV